MSGADLTLKALRPTYLDEAVCAASCCWGETLTWKEGARVGVQGPSGQGKSTLIRILCGIETAYTGSFAYGSTEVVRGRVASWPRLRSQVVSVVLQDLRLVPEWSGEENLRLVPVWADGVDRATINDWSERLEIQELLGRAVETWSKGQAQRLAILRALISPARWLLLDEPFSHLDALRTREAVTLIEDVSEARGQGWVVTHLDADPELPCEQVVQV